MGSFLTTLYDLGARTLVIASFLLLVTISGAGAGVDPIEPFLGAFAGESVTDPTGALTPHDLDVEIRQSAHGFAIHWRSAVIEHGRTERLGHEVHFESTTHSNVYRAHPPPDMMGNARTPDPIDGQPYFWARLSGRTLIVYVMSIPPDGSVDFRIYRRTVAGDRMKLEFTRMRDDVPVITAHGELRRTRVNN